MWSSDEQIKNIGIEEILAYYAGTLTSRGLMDQIKQHVQNHLLQLFDYQVLYKIGFNGKWQVKKLLNVGELIAVDQYKISMDHKRNVFDKDIGMCISNKDNLYKINFGGKIKIYKFMELFRLNYSIL